MAQYIHTSVPKHERDLIDQLERLSFYLNASQSSVIRATIKVVIDNPGLLKDTTVGRNLYANKRAEIKGQL